MQFSLITISRRVPDWIASGYNEYARRLPRSCRLELVERPPSRADTPDKIRAEEAGRLLEAARRSARVIALDERGEMWSTRELAGFLESWSRDGDDVALLVGGAEGLDQSVREGADACWSLSRLTLPHQLVRVLIAEQVYRARRIKKNHTYHRG
ncbi:MAG: 23S rRNA (pseudouridine(1915)-N(3))-methyltransferase RlmH [Gammaproteobacteria bacterium]|nr:23S rRNA (pseudouridine(1915)-N(3))-methyltransferase RlmH [Gammaproteobacteria bacterium]